jgi:hypothetical protein
LQEVVPDRPRARTCAARAGIDMEQALHRRSPCRQIVSHAIKKSDMIVF